MNDPEIRIRMSRSDTTDTVFLVLHGGRATSSEPVRATQLAFRRMLPLAGAVHRGTAHFGAAVWVLRNRVRGWNDDRLDAVRDARWALDIIGRAHPRARVALIGHSMGARAALRVADAPAVRSVCALAPWTLRTDPVAQLRDRGLLIVHGDRDRTTSPAASQDFARRARAAGARVERIVISGSGHAMLRHARSWNEHVRRFAVEHARGDAR
ncbi:alpha/beta hydrolase [Saccharopolyspora cebuensis]|uniref:Alpha/beta hydrolase n=1 Tax=Saccharopolyspora cebuensis TaxID=418759 RepID=A0ABV4CGK1_9PSEU